MTEFLELLQRVPSRRSRIRLLTMTNEEPKQYGNRDDERRHSRAPRRDPNLKFALMAAVAVTVLVAGVFVILAIDTVGKPTRLALFEFPGYRRRFRRR